MRFLPSVKKTYYIAFITIILMGLVLISAGCNSSVKRASSDTEVPVVTSFILTSGTPTTNQVIDFAIDATDNNGVAAYLINEDATPPLFTDPGWQTSKPATYTVSAGFGRFRA
jgi:hypothetical protein